MPASPRDPGSRASPGAAFFRLLLESHQDAVVVTGPGGVILYATPAAARVLGSRAAAGARLPDLLGAESGPAATGVLDPPQGEPGPVSGTWRLPGADGQPAYVEFHASDLRGEPAVGGMILILRDVTERRRREEDLRRRAFRDPLTGLANRAAFEDYAGRALARARRGDHVVAFMLGDLDGFKAVNDTLGHQAGDELLKAVAGRLASAVRAEDLAARVGGDEFAFVIDSLPSPGTASASALRVVEAITAPFPLAAGSAEVGISVGVAVWDGDADVATLVGRADRAMYTAKAAGKRTWRQYEPGMAAAPQPAAGGIGRLGALGFPAILSKVGFPRRPSRAPGARALGSWQDDASRRRPRRPT